MPSLSRFHARLIFIIGLGMGLVLLPLLVLTLRTSSDPAYAQADVTAIATSEPTATRSGIETGDPPPLEPETPTATAATVTPTATDAPAASTVAANLALAQSTAAQGDSLTAALVIRLDDTNAQAITVEGGVDGALQITSVSGGDCTHDDQLLACSAKVSAASPVNLTIALQVRPDAAPGRWALSFSVRDSSGVVARLRSTVTVTAPATSPTPTSGASTTPSPTAPVTQATAPATQPQPTARPAATTGAATASPTPAPGTIPDACEENDRLTQPCALPSEITTTDLNFLDDALDVFSVLLKGGRSYTIRADSDSGIDPVITLYQAGALDTSIARNDDVAPGTTAAEVVLTTPDDGWYLIQVENRAPGAMQGRTYRLSVRSAAKPNAPTPAPGGTVDAATVQQRGDAFENNYSVESASFLAWGVPYDLSLRCPEANACTSGDHDFFRVPLKAGIPFAALSYDLGAGTDTTIALYLPEPGFTDPATGLVGWRLAQSNDDVVAGRTLRSQILYRPAQSSDGLIIVAPAERRNLPDLPASVGPTGRYRLIAGGVELPAIQEVLNAQQDTPPTPTATATSASDRDNSGGSGASGGSGGSGGSAPAPAAPTAAPATPAPAATTVAAPTAGAGTTTDAEEIVREACLTGSAAVQAATAGFYAAAVPQSQNRLMATYPTGAQVTLLGSCYLGWVKVQPQGAVTPGWMFAGDLVLIAATSPPFGAPTASSGNGTAPLPTVVPIGSAPRAPTSPAGATSGTATTPTAAPLQVALLPTPEQTPLPTPARTRAQITVSIRDTKAQPWVGMRVQLVSVLGDLITEGLTQADGTVVLTAEIDARVRLVVQVPAISLQVPVRGPAVQISLPRAGQ